MPSWNGEAAGIWRQWQTVCGPCCISAEVNVTPWKGWCPLLSRARGKLRACMWRRKNSHKLTSSVLSRRKQGLLGSGERQLKFLGTRMSPL